MIFSVLYRLPIFSLPTTSSPFRLLIVITIGFLLSTGTQAATAEGISGDLQAYILQATEWSDPSLRHETLNDFYQSRGFSPIWVSHQGPLPRADKLLQVLRDAGKEGLDSTAYSIELLESHWQVRGDEELAQLELLLSDAALKYGRDLQTGHYPPESVNPLWFIPVPEFDGTALLETLAISDNIVTSLAGLSPPHTEYHRLRDILGYYRQLAQLGGWPTMPPGPSLRVGDTHPHISLLRERLFIEGDLVLDTSEDDEIYDELIKQAVERFQTRHGLHADGVLGPATRAAMNISIEERISQIRLNMERWRWLPRELGQRYIIVNIPEFRLRAYDKGHQVMNMDIIVGTPDRPTPIVKGDLRSLVFNPYWTAPRSLIVDDLRPKQIRDPGFMGKRKIRVFQNDMEINPRNVNWHKINSNYLPYVVRQDPGPSNPMGEAKFLFNNRFDIYLHDTPQKSLFARTERDLSSGCIRISKPAELAQFALAENDNGWNEKAVRQALADHNTQTVIVNTPLPVYLLYFTAWVGSDNRAHFRKDIYQVDNSKPVCPVFPRNLVQKLQTNTLSNKEFWSKSNHEEPFPSPFS